MTLWFKLKSDPKSFAPDDLYWLHKHHKELDALCAAKGLAPLEEFADYGDAAVNINAFKRKPRPTWVEADKLLVTLNGLKAAGGELSAEIDGAGLLEELDYVIGRCNEAVVQSVRVRFLLVM